MENLKPVIRISIKNEGGKLVIVDMNNNVNNCKIEEINWRKIAKILKKLLIQ